MKVIFLDHDGVVCLGSEWGRRIRQKTTFDPFNPGAVSVLNEILARTGAEIVISSDWRYHATLEDLKKFYTENGVIKEPIDTTTTYGMEIPIQTKVDGLVMVKPRSVEIMEWLSNHPEVTHWVAIDDMNMTQMLEHFVLTPRDMEGIKQTGVKEKVIKHLLD